MSKSLLLAAVVLACGAQAQDTRPLAIHNARILTMENGEISTGTLLVRNGVIEALGTDVEIPAGYEVVDAQGGTVLPGLVSAWSHAGLGGRAQAQPAFGGQRGRRGRRGIAVPTTRGRASNQAATVVALGIYPRQEVFGELLKAGVTTLALTPRGDGFPGTGAILDPAGKSLDELAVNREAFLVVSPAANTATKTVLREGFEAAKRLVEERNKPEEPADQEGDPEAAGEDKDAQTADADKDAEQTEEQTEEQDPPDEAGARGRGRRGRGRGGEPRTNPHHEVLADLLEGKKRAFLSINSANDLAHYLDAVSDTTYPTILVSVSAGGGGRRGGGSGGTLEQVIDKVVALDATLLLSPTLGTYPGTNRLVNPAASLHEQGLEIGFVLGENRQSVEDIFFQMMELVRHGLPRDVALRGITRVPAKALGVDAKVGSLSPGKAADLLLFSGDPLDPESRLVRIWHKGRAVERGEVR